MWQTLGPLLLYNFRWWICMSLCQGAHVCECVAVGVKNKILKRAFFAPLFFLSGLFVELLNWTLFYVTFRLISKNWFKSLFTVFFFFFDVAFRLTWRRTARNHCTKIKPKSQMCVLPSGTVAILQECSCSRPCIHLIQLPVGLNHHSWYITMCTKQENRTRWVKRFWHWL